jgi:hypothetical protein
MDTAVLSWSKATETWSWTFTSIQCKGRECVDLYLRSSINLHGVMLRPGTAVKLLR